MEEQFVGWGICNADKVYEVIIVRSFIFYFKHKFKVIHISKDFDNGNLLPCISLSILSAWEQKYTYLKVLKISETLECVH